MGRSINSNKLTKTYILENVSQITIFSVYLNLSDDVIKNCIDTGELILSPLREDVHPTCGFRYDNRGKLKFRDFAGYFWGDCFDVVALIINTMYNKNLNVKNKSDFIKILRHITFTFKDIFYGHDKDNNLIDGIHTAILNIKRKKPIIELVVRSWYEEDEEYWRKIGVNLKFLNLNFVYPVDQYYINRNINPEPKYYYNSKDPCYGYFLGKDKYGVNNIKLYFPNREKDTTRFITNCNHLEGIYNLNKSKYDIIIVTKSSKDRLSIGATILRMKSLYGGVDQVIGVINIPHETYRLKENEYYWLHSKLNINGVILSLMDNDETGIKESIWLKDNYNITPILIPQRFKSKDFAELITNVGFNKVCKLIIETIDYVKHGQSVQLIRDKEENSSSPF